MANKLAPLVTGISPAEGPPGTTVKIRGENLGKDSKDLIGETFSLTNRPTWLNPKPGLLRFWPKKFFERRRGSGGILLQKILKIGVLRLAVNAFPTF